MPWQWHERLEAKRKQKIIDALKAHPEAQVKTIARCSGLAFYTVMRLIPEMKGEGTITAYWNKDRTRRLYVAVPTVKDAS